MRRAHVPAGALLIILWLFAAPVTETAREKVATLAKCPAWGAEERGSTRAVLNEVKHRVPTASAPVTLEFGDLDALQRQADGLVRSGVSAKVSARDRAKLKDLASGARQFSEGDLVSIVAFVAGKPTANFGESANCYLSGPANNDFEFSLVSEPAATPYQGIVAEMIPQDRPAGWTLAKLHKLAADHREVLVVGQLMFDTRHLPNPKRGTNHESPRVSTWEIHPVTKMLVCRRGSGCAATSEADWQPLEQTTN